MHENSDGGPTGRNRRWSLDFTFDALRDSRRFRILCMIDNNTPITLMK